MGVSHETTWTNLLTTVMTSAAHALDPSEPRRRYAQLLQAAQEEYAADARRGQAGRVVQARYSDQLDDLVRQLATAAERETGTRWVLCAVGGYGRRSMCLHSDIDLLITFDGRIARPEERFVNVLLQPLWDLRLRVGHHVRELEELDDPDEDNPEFLLALCDVRHLAGDADLLTALRERAFAGRPDAMGRLREALLALIDARHEQFSHSIYQLEPDLKQAPGGLRDIGAVRLLSAFAADVLPANGQSDPSLDEIEDWLLRIRSILHLEARRDMNVLTHDYQDRVAQVMAGDGASMLPVEELMGRYFGGARMVARTLDHARRLGDRREPGRPVQPAGRHLVLTGDGIDFADPARAASQPALWVEAFRVAIAEGAPVSESARALITQHLDSYGPDDYVATEGERLQIRRLLTPRTGLYARLSEMHDCGLLEAIFPELRHIHCRVIRDFYHRYTVDEHTLMAIRNLEALTGPVSGGRSRFASLLEEVRSPELLTLALLYHDVGKWQAEEDHVEASLALAQPMVERLQLPAEARQTVEFLIRHHLQMSQVAFRRDSEDPEVASRFAALVESEERLKMLTLMTLVDIQAVSPETLTPWKEDLLWRVYVEAYNRLTMGYADELIQKDQAGLAVVVAGRPDDIGEAELTRFLNGLPRRYLTVFGLATIYAHARLARGLKADEMHAALENRDGIWELTVVMRDRPFLFSNISGVLSYFGMDIHRGQAMTTPDHLVLDVFDFSDSEGFLARNPGAAAEIYRMLEGVAGGTVDVQQLLRGREGSLVHRPRRRVAPMVNFDNEHSRRYTVIEIIADDTPGLLYRVSSVISDHECDVDLVLISTEGQKAIDVLHVTRHGQKLSDTEQTQLAHDIARILEAGYEAH